MPETNGCLWQLIPFADHESPAEPTTQTVRNNFSDFIQRLGFGKQPDPDEPLNEPEQQLRSLPDDIIEQTAPEPDWTSGYRQALNETYQSWLEMDASQAGVGVVINAPHSHLPHCIRGWAAEQGCTVIEAPSTSQIIGDQSEWFAGLGDAGQSHWVLPNLERCFLRHQEGLNLLRAWLDWVAAHPSGLIVCDSWAWSYLSRILRLNHVLRNAQTLAPFDAVALKCWFAELAGENGEWDCTFRQADSGKVIIEPGKQQQGESNQADADEDEAAFLRHLAAHSRGQPEIAWHIWQNSLMVAEERAVEASDEEKASLDRGRTIWVRPWDQMELPKAPGQYGTREAFVLHALLLHDGLSDEWLARLLPLLSHEVAATLRRLQATGLISRSNECRRVTDEGYAAVRAFLRSEGFLTDVL